MATRSLHAVRVEAEESIGRSYSAVEGTWGAHGARSIPGIGARRRELRTKSFNPYANGSEPVLESATMALVNLRRARREDVLAYFRNTVALTDTLFAALRDDSVFYMVPDKLRCVDVRAGRRGSPGRTRALAARAAGPPRGFNTPLRLPRTLHFPALCDARPSHPRAPPAPSLAAGPSSSTLRTRRPSTATRCTSPACSVRESGARARSDGGHRLRHVEAPSRLPSLGAAPRAAQPAPPAPHPRDGGRMTWPRGFVRGKEGARRRSAQTRAHTRAQGGVTLSLSSVTPDVTPHPSPPPSPLSSPLSPSSPPPPPTSLLADNVNLYFQKLFETGVDEMSWDDMDEMQDEDFAWPDVADAQAFRAAVHAAVEDLIMNKMPDPSVTPLTMESPWWSLFMGFEHEKIHLETSSVLFRQLPVDCVVEPAGWRTAPTFASAPDQAPSNALVTAAPATVVLGKPTSFPSFGWDNEYGQRKVDVPAFAASKYLVSNAEFLPFVEAGGYMERKWWVSSSGDDEGWRWRMFRNATHPSFWVASAHPAMAKYIGGKPTLPFQKDDGHPRAGSDNAWKLRTEFSIIAMPWDWPVEVNSLESAAFLRWKAATEGSGAVYRLPTEAEHHVARDDPSPFPEATVGKRAGAMAGEGAVPQERRSANSPAPPPASPSASPSTSPVPSATTLEDGKVYKVSPETALVLADPEASSVDVSMQLAVPGNTNWRWQSSTPVDFYGPSSAGFHDTHGNVWQWVEDHFAPLPGFEIHYLYDDFSAPCFDGWHTVIMGGSWVSSGQLAGSFARYHFRRHFFQHMGFRYVRVAPEAPEPYPGAASVLNLWEGGNALSRDVTDGYGAEADKLRFAPGIVAPTASLSYGDNLAALVTSAYASHVSASAASAPSAQAARVLHVGCGAGAGTFSLSRSFGSVTGMDLREPLIRAARLLMHHGQLEYERVREGVLTDTTLVRVSRDVDRARVAFHVGDATAATLPEEVVAAGPYDVVVLDSLLTRLRQPLDALTRAGGLVKPGGLLVISSTNDWTPSATPRNSWLGGFKMNGEAMGTLDMLKYPLKKAGFALVESADLARLSRHHDRRYTLDVLETSVWRRG
jgi:formylglycine-generating enzyme required for sulfatase activity/2-polyprenyl-3-methyl-5-hydroxy-6-metoxy-1,4-benzoquinol methylase